MKKIIAGLGLTLVVALVIFASAPNANASTLNITAGRDLATGSTGQDVVVLQMLLSELGFLNVPIGIPFGYFGSMTKSALASYESVSGVSPATGYYGALAKTAMNNQFSSRGWSSLLGW